MSQSSSNSDGKGGQEKKATADVISENENFATRTSKVGLGLIETILDEMKSEFNRELNVGENVRKEKDEESKEPAEEKCKAVRKELLIKSEGDGDSKKDNSKVEDEESEQNKSAECSDKIEKPIEAGVGESKASTEPCKTEEKPVRVESDDSKSRISLNSKASDESIDGIKKNKSKNIPEIESNSSDTLSSVKESEIDVCGTPTSSSVVTSSSASGKRSLRSKAAAVKAQNEEPEGVKRSARRRSKDSPRESVLQSAIARKEKSFSTLSQGDDKSLSARNIKTLSHRSPRHSPVDKNQASRTSKSPVRLPPPPPKSPRLAQQIAEQASSKLNSTEENTSASGDSASKTSTTEAQPERAVTQKNVRSVVKSVHSSNTHAYTKTGKRRYRPYKGLRYSFTGNNVRRTKPPRRHVKDVASSSSNETKKPEEPEEKTGVEVNQEQEEEQEQPTPVVTAETEQLEYTDPIAKSHAAEFPSADICGSRSGSPVIAEACQTTSQKRKFHPEEDDDVRVVFEEDGNKRGRLSNVPSPSPADSSQRPAKPESTAISSGAGTAGLCCCQTKSQLYVSSRGQNGTAAEIYCQAMDTLDDRVVGCCNAVTSRDTCLSRPSRRVPFLILCDVHMHRLLRHNCCPGCGIFCTQGKFVQCPSAHWYHRACQLTTESASVCPHCGLDSPVNDVMLSMRSGKNPVFLPQQKPPKKVPSAKMTFGASKVSGAKTEEVTLREPTPPLVLPVLLPSQVSTATLDKDKLAKLLSVACSMHKSTTPSPRYSLKSLYQAAKSGSAEKLAHILASGLNPNHLFRECSMGTALHAACAGGHLSVVHMLLQVGANMDVLDRDQYTPLMLAAVANHNDVVKYLVKAGASITLKGCDGMTALHIAAKAGNIESCHYLLSVTNLPRTYIDTIDDGGWTPLVWAAEHRHVDAARYLLQHRADPLIRDAEQNIALHWSAYSGSVDISEMLLNHGCEVNSTNVHGDTPLHIGARQNMYNCVLLLLARGARVDITNIVGDSPLDCCIAENNECYVAINLNIQLKARVKHSRQRTQRILTNDISRGQEQNPIQCVNAMDDEDEPTEFVYVSENCFTSNISVERTITSLQSCKCTDICTTVNCHCANISLRCWYDEQGRLIPEFNYADPPMLFECNQMCTCNRITCHNRVVQHGLTTRFQLFRTKDKGWGVRTLRTISKGTYVCEYIGEIISDCEADHREDDSYLFDLDNRDGETYCIDARHYGNVARFINHMCVPNLLPVRVFIEHQDLHFPRIAFFANRDIEADEELGFDYGEKFWIIKCKSFTCTCGAESCRYSETTIKQTLDNYNKRLLQDELMQRSELQLLQ